LSIRQALVFMLLTAVFTMLIAEHEEGNDTRHNLIFGDLTTTVPKTN